MYYALSGSARAMFYRHEITRSAKNDFLIRVGAIIVAGRMAVAKTVGLEP